MKTELSFKHASKAKTEMLVVFAVDRATAKGAKAAPELATGDAALKVAANVVLRSGEFKATAGETVLVHAPAALGAKRLLIVGLGKAAKATIHDARKGAAVAVRFAKPKSIREIAIAMPEDALLPPGPCVQALVEGAYLGDFDSDTYRSDRVDQSLEFVEIYAPEKSDKNALDASFKEGVVLAAARRLRGSWSMNRATC